MRIEYRNGRVRISGYVNAVGRDSRPIPIPTGGEFVEMIEPGTFREALTRAKDVRILLNHDERRKLGCTSDGSLRLREDNIGLYADFETSDAEVVSEARSGGLRGWSFGMYVNRDEMEQRGKKPPRRHVQSIDLYEVSVIDRRMTPAYAGTSVECRSEKNVIAERRAIEDPADAEGGKAQKNEWQKRIDALRK